MIQKRCVTCRQLFSCQQKRVLLCPRCKEKQNYKRRYASQTEAIALGHCHAGERLTPVPQAVLDRVAKEKESETLRRERAREAALMAIVLPRIEKPLPLMEPQSSLEDWVAVERNRKEGLSGGGVACCGVCGRRLTIYGCSKSAHNSEEGRG